MHGDPGAFQRSLDGGEIEAVCRQAFLASTVVVAAVESGMPRVLAVDWSHDVVDRDWMIQSCMHFGRVDGPSYASWSEVVITSLRQIAEDIEYLGQSYTELADVLTSLA